MDFDDSTLAIRLGSKDFCLLNHLTYPQINNFERLCILFGRIAEIHLITWNSLLLLISAFFAHEINSHIIYHTQVLCPRLCNLKEPGVAKRRGKCILSHMLMTVEKYVSSLFWKGRNRITDIKESFFFVRDFPQRIIWNEYYMLWQFQYKTVNIEN